LILTIQIGTVALIVAALAALAVLVWALVRVVDAMSSVKRLADDTDRELMPAIAKADATLDALNEELGRVHLIVDQVRDVTESVTETRKAADRVVDEAVVGLTRITRAVGTVFRSKGRG
jgi:ABC-type transporter Mla subunit MlaD